MENDKLVNPQDTNDKLEIERQVKQYKLVLESLFTDAEDTRLTRILTIGNSVGLGVLLLVNLFFIFTK